MRPFGELLRHWRERRGKSQLALATEADISTKHLSFLETGRSAPSREMVLRLARVLDVALRERNAWLHAAGFSAAYTARRLDDPALVAARRAVDLVLTGFEPYPALAIDRAWNLIAANDAVPPLLAGADPSLLRPPVNVLRLSLHPAGLAPRIQNLAQWRAHLLERLERQIEATADPALSDLLAELRTYPAPQPPASSTEGHDYGGIAVPLQLLTPDRVLTFLSTTTVFGAPLDVTLSELALESFLPADAETADSLRDAAARKRASAASGQAEKA
jgi:transcriptional regulator with XRE-family HTH domain